LPASAVVENDQKTDGRATATAEIDLSVYYIRQVNGVKLADILFSLLSVCLFVCVCTSGQTGLVSLGRQPVKEKENSDSKPGLTESASLSM